MDNGQERPYTANPPHPRDGLTHSEDFLRQLDRVAGAGPTSPGAAAGLGELMRWMAEELPSPDGGRSPGTSTILVVGGRETG